ncbi:SDR family NAD(P)-dependent oxidoreductase [Cohnella thailandensis]|uniref:SDR family oxidoreductase n=1 Tax=Cohnella thailandensis TaxID=557557 RepID=A0A841SWJ1_9BACL|nr:SDR family oxidoreductase [Cohnella thailandensis]MBB6634230.1 SDR family oxidoreductase [Cohnella thailandensis]MBP1972272.1 short-subunit dehydrogenase [Cohnella thailandensis]
MNKYIYKNKLALVTGASSGIGKAYAKELASRGCHVVLAARSKDKLDVLARDINRQYGVQAHALACDLSKPNAPRQLAEQLSGLGLSVDILINNAGVGTHGLFEDIEPEREQDEIRLNTASLVDLTHRLLPDMLRRKDGIVVNVASMAAFMPCAYSAVYGATKAFVLSFSEALWAETRGRGVRVLALCPGATETGFFDAVGSQDMAAGQKLSTPERVVQAGFRGIDQGRSYIIDGRNNYLMAQSIRFFSRRQVALIMERMSRPKRQG